MESKTKKLLGYISIAGFIFGSLGWTGNIVWAASKKDSQHETVVSDVKKLKDKVATLENKKQVKDVETKALINELDMKVGYVQETNAKMDKQLSEIKEEIKENHRDVNKKLDAILMNRP